MPCPQAENTRVLVGMSGGMDSAVSARLLKDRGYAVTGVTMQVWDGSLPLPDEGRCGCYGPGEVHDIESARRLAAKLDIPHITVPLAKEYKGTVLDYFRSEYLAGRTPNPCVLCNRELKFGLLVERAAAQGLEFDYFATGHYARIVRDGVSGRYQLKTGVDAAKDQSYFLCRLTQAQLARSLFPLGDLTKGQVRALCLQAGWTELANRAESQDFIESRDHGLLFDTEDVRPGPIVDRDGRVLGRHRGLVHYTIGQRRGLGIGGAAEPLYVIRLDAETNTVVVGRRPELLGRRLQAFECNWIAFAAPPPGPFRAQVKIRLRHPAAAARVIPQADDRVVVEFDEMQNAITSGQTAVFYDHETVLGGGTIDAL